MPYFDGGFVGVDVFFVIRGYLITSIIITEIRAGSFSLLNFYERRARRILPALFMVTLACVPSLGSEMRPDKIVDFSYGLLSVAVFASNFYFGKHRLFRPSQRIQAVTPHLEPRGRRTILPAVSNLRDDGGRIRAPFDTFSHYDRNGGKFHGRPVGVLQCAERGLLSAADPNLGIDARWHHPLYWRSQRAAVDQRTCLAARASR